MSVGGAQLCRVSIQGPHGRADLAVPATTTVAALMSIVVDHVVEEDPGTELDGPRSWVLQRLGEAPFDPDGTAETLDWKNGERFYLRPASDPMPELDFDDIADAMATAVSRRGDRWNPAVNRRMFLALAALAFVTAAAVLYRQYAPLWSSISALVLALGTLTTAVVVARLRGDGPLAAVLGLAGCGYAGLAATFAAHRPEPRLVDTPPQVVLLGAAAVVAAALALLALQRMVATSLPIVPFGIAGGLGIGALVAGWFYLGLGLSVPQAAAMVGILGLGLLIVAPQLATRSARLRGPQLPRTADELQIDVEPYPAQGVVERVGIAEGYLTVVVGTAATLTAGACAYLLTAPTWATRGFAALFAASVLLRAREFKSVPQRLILVAGGTFGAAAVVLSEAATLQPPYVLLVLLGLVFAALVLILAALRPETRRLLPLWGYLANAAELLGSLALLPLLLYVLGVFAWARGLAG
jgi:type VII secretion integral membrane protein EccD